LLRYIDETYSCDISDSKEIIMRILLALIVLGLLAPASAQTLRDKNGNPIGHCEQQGDRTYFRDNNGNPHGYSTTLPNGTTEYRDNNGNLRARETPR
jgi:hypothetical protein